MVSQQNSLQVIGRGTQITFTINDMSPIKTVLLDVEQYLEHNSSWFLEGSISINVGKRMFRKDELRQIKNLITIKSGLTVSKFTATSTQVGLDPQKTKDPAELELVNQQYQPEADLSEANQREDPNSRSGESEATLDPEVEPVKGVESLLIKTPCRSGELINYPGNVIVMADVNPGAQIYAGGDIMVYGRLRGFCHAGSPNNPEAVITALSLETNILSIASINGTSVEDHSKPNLARPTPKIAFLKRGAVFVAPYIGRFSSYDGGTIYDR